MQKYVTYVFFFLKNKRQFASILDKNIVPGKKYSSKVISNYSSVENNTFVFRGEIWLPT